MSANQKSKDFKPKAKNQSKTTMPSTSNKSKGAPKRAASGKQQPPKQLELDFNSSFISVSDIYQHFGKSIADNISIQQGVAENLSIYSPTPLKYTNFENTMSLLENRGYFDLTYDVQFALDELKVGDYSLITTQEPLKDIMVEADENEKNGIVLSDNSYFFYDRDESFRIYITSNEIMPSIPADSICTFVLSVAKNVQFAPLTASLSLFAFLLLQGVMAFDEALEEAFFVTDELETIEEDAVPSEEETEALSNETIPEDTIIPEEVPPSEEDEVALEENYKALSDEAISEDIIIPEEEVPSSDEDEDDPEEEEVSTPFSDLLFGPKVQPIERASTGFANFNRVMQEKRARAIPIPNISEEPVALSTHFAKKMVEKAPVKKRAPVPLPAQIIPHVHSMSFTEVSSKILPEKKKKKTEPTVVLSSLPAHIPEYTTPPGPVREDVSDLQDDIKGYNKMADLLSQVVDMIKDKMPEVKLFTTAFYSMFLASLVTIIMVVRAKAGSAAIVSSVTTFLLAIITALSIHDEFLRDCAFSSQSVFRALHNYLYYNGEGKFANEQNGRTFRNWALKQKNRSAVNAAYQRIRFLPDPISSVEAALIPQSQNFEFFTDLTDNIFLPIIAVILSVISESVSKANDYPARFFKLIERITTNKGKLSDLAERVVSFFVPSRSYGHKLIEQRKRNLAVIQHPIARILTDSNLYQELVDCAKTSQKMYNGVMRRDGQNEIYKTFMHSSTLVEAKIMELNKVTCLGANKMVPASFYFWGERAAGKTTLLTTKFCKDVCERLGIRSTTYNLKKDDGGFFREYAGQTLAFMDEVADKADSSPQFSFLNECISCAATNLPSAFIKEQPFMSRLLFAISNCNLYDASSRSGLMPESAAAMRSRFTEVEIVNPAVDNTKERGSHPEWYEVENFKFYVYDPCTTNVSRRTKREISYKELIDLVCNKHQLMLDQYTCNVPVNQSLGTPIVINFNGPQDTGKTTQALVLKEFFEQQLKKKFIQVDQIEDMPTLKEGDHVFLNDALNETTKDNKRFFELEKLGSSGMVISTTNIQANRISFREVFSNTKIFVLFIIGIFMNRSFKLPTIYKSIFSEQGFYRRLGFSGIFSHGNDVIDVKPTRSLEVRSMAAWRYMIGGNVITSQTLLENILLEMDRFAKPGINDVEVKFEEELRNKWHVCLWFDSPHACYEAARSMTLFDIKYKAEPNTVAVSNLTDFNGAALDPTIFLNGCASIADVEGQLQACFQYATTRMPHLTMLAKVGDFVMKASNGTISTSFKPRLANLFEEEDQIYYEGESYPKKIFLDYCALGVTTGLNFATINIFAKIKKTSKFPPQLETEYRNIMDNIAMKKDLGRFDMILKETKRLIAGSWVVKLLLAIIAVCVIVPTTVAIAKSISEKKPDSQKMKRQRAALKARDGRKYYMTNNGPVYEGDEDFSHSRYEDLLETDEYHEEIGQLKPTRIQRDGRLEEWELQSGKLIYLDPDVFDRLTLTVDKPDIPFGVLIPSGGIFKNVDVICRKRGSTKSFSFTCREAFTFSTFEDMFCYNQDYGRYGMTYDSVKKMFAEQSSVTLLCKTAKQCQSYIALPEKAIHQILKGKIDEFESTIATDCATNAIVCVETGKKYYLNFKEIRTTPGKRLGLVNGAKRIRRYFKVVSFSNEEELQSQMVKNLMRSNTVSDLLIKKATRNSVQILTSKGAVAGVVLHEGWILTVRHAVVGIPIHEIEVFENEDKYEPLEVMCHPTSDIALIKTRLSKPSILKNIGSVNSGMNLVALAAAGDEPTFATVVRAMAVPEETTSGVTLAAKICFKGHFILNPGLITRNGDCGRVYILMDDNEPKIIGIHVAGTSISCYGTQIDMKWVEQYVKPVSQNATRYDIPEFTKEGGFLKTLKTIPLIVSPSKPYSQPNPLREYLGHLTPSLKQPVKTSISQCTEAELSNIPLNAYGTHDFYLGQILQYNDQVIDAPTSDCIEFVEGFMNKYGPSLANHQAGNILSHEEALLGITDHRDPLYRYTSSLTWDTAIGYEMKKNWKVRSMNDIYDVQNQCYRDTPAAEYFEDKCRSAVHMAFEGRKQLEILQDNLKQENRENEKAYKQRVFTAFPKSLSMLVRTFTLRFASWVNKNHELLPYKTAMNTAAEFDGIRREAEIFSPDLRCFGFDISRCDKHIREQFFEEVLFKIFQRVVEQQHRDGCNCGRSVTAHVKALRVVVRHLYNNVIASQDVLYEKKTGSSSGSDLTILINVIYVHWLLFSWFRQGTSAAPGTFTAFCEILHLLLCGDDAKVIVKSGFLDDLNFITLKRYLATRGITIDSPAKDGSEFPHQHFDDVPFVSRSWVKAPNGIWIHKFKIEIVSGLIYWIRELSNEQLEFQLRVLAELIAPYGEAMYVEFLDGCHRFLRDYSIAFVPPTYREALMYTLAQSRGLAFVHKVNLTEPLPNSQSKLEMTSPQAVAYSQWVRNILWSLRHHVQEWGHKLSIEFQDQVHQFIDVVEKKISSEQFDPSEEVLLVNAFPAPERPILAPLPDVNDTTTTRAIALARFKRAKRARNMDFDTNATLFLISFVRLYNDLAGKQERYLERMDGAGLTIKHMNTAVLLEAFMVLYNFNKSREQPTSQMDSMKMKDTSAPTTPKAAASAAVARNDMNVSNDAQLASVDLPVLNPMENTYSASTISYGNPQSLRIPHLPSDFLAFGGIIEDLKDVAYGSYQTVEVINVPVNTQRGTVVYVMPYSLEAFGAYAKRWAELHRRFIGPIIIRFRFVSNSVIQGQIRAYWNIEGKPRTIANSSQFGAHDIDLSAPTQSIEMMLHPVAGPTGQFYYEIDNPPTKQGEIVLITLTEIGNSFSELGNLQIIVESRPSPEMLFADPTDPDTPIAGNADLELYLNEQGVSRTDTTMVVETKKYPKFPNLPSEVVGEDAVKFPKDSLKTDFASLNNVGVIQSHTDSVQTINFGTITTDANVTKTTLVGEKIVTELSGLMPIPEYEPQRMTINQYPDSTVEFTNLDGESNEQLDVSITEQFYAGQIGNRIHHGSVFKLSIPNTEIETARASAKAPALTNVNQYLTEANVTNITASAALDSKSLPNTFYSVELASVKNTQALSATAPDLNSAVRSDFGWAVHNYCYERCPAKGQIKISIRDPTFGSTLSEFIYRPEVGFITSAVSTQKNTIYNGNLVGYVLEATIYPDQSTVATSNDFSGFISRVEAQRRRPTSQMEVLGGVLGGLGSGMASWASMQNQLKLQQNQIQSDEQLAIWANQNNIDVQTLKGAQLANQQRQQWNQRYATNNLQNTARNTVNAHNQPASLASLAQNALFNQYGNPVNAHYGVSGLRSQATAQVQVARQNQPFSRQSPPRYSSVYPSSARPNPFKSTSTSVAEEMHNNDAIPLKTFTSTPTRNGNHGGPSSSFTQLTGLDEQETTL